MKKRIIIILVVLLAVIGAIVNAFLNRGGDVSKVRTSFTSTDYHSEDDIKQSMKIVKDFFQKKFKGCTLTDLWYDDAVSLDAENEWKQQYNGEEAIILSSNFDVDASGGDGSLDPNETYTDWQWILVKNSDGEWKLETYGY